MGNISKNRGSLIEKQMDTPKSYQKYKARKEEIKNQKSIKDFFRKNIRDNLSSDSSQQEEAAEKKEQKKEKVQKHAIEKTFEENKSYLTSFESFQKKEHRKIDKDVKPPKEKESKE